MRTYELMLIARPTLDDKALTETIEAVSELFTTRGGEVQKVSKWGRRKLAYAIDDLLEGIYVLFNLSLDPAALKDVEFNLKLNESVLRYMVVKADGIVVAEEEATEAPVAAEEAEETPATDEAETVADEAAE